MIKYIVSFSIMIVVLIIFLLTRLSDFDLSEFMVRKLKRCFKYCLTMNVVSQSVMMTGD